MKSLQLKEGRARLCQMSTEFGKCQTGRACIKVSQTQKHVVQDSQRHLGAVRFLPLAIKLLGDSPLVLADEHVVRRSSREAHHG